MQIEIFNSSKDILYFDTLSGEMLPSNLALFPKRISGNDLDSSLANGLFVLRKPGTYRPVAGIIPIPGRTRWSFDGHAISYLEAPWYKKINKNTQLSRIEKIALHYLRFIKDKIVAVELSGGLDTALIIEFLKQLEVKMVFVGFNSFEYEFRTERTIQNHYLQFTEKSQMIDYQRCSAFGNLRETPIHPFPMADSLYHSRHSMIAKATHDLGANILLNGNAGDSLLGHGFKNFVYDFVPDGYDPWSITDIWTVETIFKPLGITYACPFAFNSVIRAFLAIRCGEADDPMKLWARRAYSNLLPYQLSRYAYKANHDCWVADGLKLAEDDIRDIVTVALGVTKNQNLNVDSMIFTARHYFHAGEREKHEFLMKLSFAVWIYGFVREGLI